MNRFKKAVLHIERAEQLLFGVPHVNEKLTPITGIDKPLHQAMKEDRKRKYQLSKNTCSMLNNLTCLDNARVVGSVAQGGDETGISGTLTPASFDMICTEAKITESDVVMDAGSANGNACVQLSLSSGCKCIGVEYNSKMHNLALCLAKAMKRDYPDRSNVKPFVPVHGDLLNKAQMRKFAERTSVVYSFCDGQGKDVRRAVMDMFAQNGNIRSLIYVVNYKDIRDDENWFKAKYKIDNYSDKRGLNLKYLPDMYMKKSNETKKALLISRTNAAPPMPIDDIEWMIDMQAVEQTQRSRRPPK